MMEQKVWLNSGTKFRYPVTFNSQTRDVFVEGEAYFNVAKDANHPFVVSAGSLKIKVLGTSFNGSVPILMTMNSPLTL